jgi:hypothetical protein
MKSSPIGSRRCFSISLRKLMNNFYSP